MPTKAKGPGRRNDQDPPTDETTPKEVCTSQCNAAHPAEAVFHPAVTR